MILCDIHTHSHNSFDAESSVDEMCAAAVKRGLYALAVTDHCEAPFIKCGENCEFGSFDRLIPKSLADTAAAKAKYEGQLRVLRGIELGEPMHDPVQTRRALDYGEFDFVLASVHNLREHDDFYYMDYTKVNIPELLSKYFDELAETAAFPYFDSLSHLTYPLRYIFERAGGRYDLTAHIPQIKRIFNILIMNNKALEINVSGLFKKMNELLPDSELISLYYEMGGRLITIGSDAHSADMVGKGIDRGIEAARKAGFKEYFIYENHDPVPVAIG